MTASPRSAAPATSVCPSPWPGHHRLADAGNSTEQENTMEAGDTQIMIAGNLGDDPQLRLPG